jgi:hypothetical protein
MDEFLQTLTVVAAQAERLMIAFTQWAQGTAENAERKHHRHELLEAYRRRHHWKKADLPHLRTLAVNPAARRRMSALTGVGRPVVRPHEPLSTLLTSRLRSFQALHDPNTLPHVRKRALKQWPWWNHYVEALYRGELADAQSCGIRRASLAAEDIVGKAFNISGASVRKICAQIRLKRQEWDGAANFPSMRLQEFNHWMRTGENPRLRSESTDSEAGTQ